MNNELSKVVEDLKSIADDARAKFGSLSSAQLNWKPAEGSWSIAQCCEHLIKSNDAFDPEFERLASGSRKQTFWESYSPLTSFFGNFLLKALKNDAKKYKAPSKDILPPSDLPADMIERFCVHQTDLAEKIKKADNVDWQKTVVTSPFLKLMTYRLSTAFEIAVEHERRHFRQAERVMAAEGFPAN